MRRYGIVRLMLLVGMFALALVLLLIFGDWMHFTSLSPSSSRYGYGVGREEDCLPIPSQSLALDRFSPNGLISLRHGIARVFPEDKRILLRPQYRMFSMRFRTAWPMKGTIDVKEDGASTRLTCVKRIPWSSAVVTLIWFAVVGLGTVGFMITYALEGGMQSLSSIVIGLGIAGVGILVFLFGLITVSLAYRLENARLREAYNELRDALTGGAESQ